MRFPVTAVGLACITLLSACGGGGSGSSGGAVQAISFNFPGGATVAIPPDIQTTPLKATASSGGPVTYTSNTPDVCTVSGSTLSLLKAGECSVTASQAGFEGYAPTSERQLFVVPKRPQKILFRNPGAQALDTQPVALAASSDVGRPVTFSTSTPSVCAVSGSTMTKLANGLCTITAQQDGGDIYMTASVVRNVPIGTEKSPALTFLSGYKDTSNTKELGAVSSYSGSSVDGGWCGGDWCARTISGDGSSFSYYYNIQPTPPAKVDWAYWGFTILAGGLQAMSGTGNTISGVRIDAQSALKLNIAQNAEWFSTGNNAVNIDLYLGHFALKNGKACNVKLHAQLKPSAAAATDYSVGLRDKFTIGESCGLTGLDLWNELQDYPISKIEISAAGTNGSVATASAAKLTYQTKLTLNGPVTFQ